MSGWVSSGKPDELVLGWPVGVGVATGVVIGATVNTGILLLASRA